MGWIHEKSQENLENLRLGKTEGKIFAILIEYVSDVLYRAQLLKKTQIFTETDSC